MNAPARREKSTIYTFTPIAEQTVKRSNAPRRSHATYPSGCPSFTFGRLAASIPIQSQLGLLPKRWTRISGFNSGDTTANGKNLVGMPAAQFLTVRFEGTFEVVKGSAE